MTADSTRQPRRAALRIFFGAAPGVGKTCAMLEAAQAARRGGVDVVIGWIETHGRPETESLAVGIERVRPRELEYRGIRIREFDLDSALGRAPAILLVDELAHTNAPGSRHARRHQDVEELLDAGIDVWTTLNVQHVESLNDVVARITGVVVKETVPDAILERADEIELVDVTPDALIERLEQGKVYVPDVAERALRRFFTKGNLIALRELALRRTAERVDQQASQWKLEHGISQPWATAERVLVSVGPAPQSANVIRAAARVAARLRAPWIALSVETAAFERMTADDRERVDTHLTLARHLGAETLVVRGDRIDEQILAVARERNVTRIVVGKPTRRRVADRVRGSLLDRLIRRSGDIEVIATTGDDAPTSIPGPATAPPRRPFEYVWALGVVAAATALCLSTRATFQTVDHAMILLLAVVLCARRWSLGPSILGAIASVAAFDFFFVPPFNTLTVSDARYVVTFAVMLLVGLTVSRLTVRVREQAASADARERRTAALFAMNRDLLVATSEADVATCAMRHIREFFAADSAVFLSESQGGIAKTGCAGGIDPRDEDRAIARWVHAHEKPAGFGTETLPGSDVLFLPLIGAAGSLGVLGIAVGRRTVELTPSERQLLETFVSQTAQALDRLRFAGEAAAARLSAETERTRNTLLRAVSHDLRTPLTTVTGAAEALLSDDGRLGDPARRELLESIHEEASRLTRLIHDILDLTRLESGTIALNKEWHPIEEIVGAAITRVEPSLKDRPLRIVMPPAVVLVPVDATLFEQVLVNLVENALKYGTPGTPIEIAADLVGRELAVEVRDHGEGIPSGTEEAVFERFYRAADSARAEGTGLGLAICRAIVTAHGGVITARRREGGGTVMRFAIPLGDAPSPTEPPRDGGSQVDA